MATLKCIIGLGETEVEYRGIMTSLKEKYGTGTHKSFDKSELFEDYDYTSGYAKNVHTGKLKEGIELTELELSMICDDGYSHFGGSSVINKDRSFSVTIYTD